MITRDQVRRLTENASAAVNGTTAGALSVTALQDQWIRHMLSLTITNLAGTAQTVTMYQGDTTTPTRKTLDAWVLPASPNDKTKYYQGTLEVPLYTIRPTTGTTTASGNNFYFKASAAAATGRMRVSYRFWDEL